MLENFREERRLILDTWAERDRRHRGQAEVTTSGFNIHTVGIILMVAGALGLVLSLLFWSSFSPYRRGADTVVEERTIHRDVP